MKHKIRALYPMNHKLFVLIGLFLFQICAYADIKSGMVVSEHKLASEGVPGTVLGFETVLKKYGTLP